MVLIMISENPIFIEIIIFYISFLVILGVYLLQN
jgi:hypothetical protein